MIRTSKQLKDLIRNLSKEKRADAQLLMRNYMMERLLERISLSVYKEHFILKGGMLVSSMVGLESRSTMDMDATVKGLQVNSAKVTEIMEEIIRIPLDDQVVFLIVRVDEIMDESDYPGIRINMVALFDGIRTPLKVDISTGDIITPKEINYPYQMMFESRKIDVLAYNLMFIAVLAVIIFTYAYVNDQIILSYMIAGAYVLTVLFNIAMNSFLNKRILKRSYLRSRLPSLS